MIQLHAFLFPSLILLSLLFITAHSLSFVQANRKKRLREYAIQGITGVGLFQNRNFVRLLVDSVHSLCTHAHKRFVDTLRNRRRKSSLSHLIRSEPINRFDSIRFENRFFYKISRRVYWFVRKKSQKFCLQNIRVPPFILSSTINRAVFNPRRNRAASLALRDETKRISYIRRNVYFTQRPHKYNFSHLFFTVLCFLDFYFTFLLVFSFSFQSLQSQNDSHLVTRNFEMIFHHV